MTLFKPGDKVQRHYAAMCSGGWAWGHAVLTVHSCKVGAITFKEDPNKVAWDPEFFEHYSSPTSVPGRKDDSGKLDMTLLDDMPRAMAALVEVMQWAITDKKPTPYVRGSWLGVHADRYRAAILRHNRDAGQQASTSNQPTRFERDKETNLLHLAHQACSAMMALENTLREIEKQGNANV